MELESSFEADLREALLDDVERKLVGEFDPILFRAVEVAHERLRTYGDRFDYNVEPIIDSFELGDVDRGRSSLTVRWGWTHEASVYLEFGTSDHTIQGDPVLSFVWSEADDPPAWVREEFESEGDGYRVFLPEVEVAGVRETRYIRRSIRWLRSELT